MTHQAIITRWQASTPQERDLWVRRVVFPELGEKPSDYHEHMKCPACGYDAHWEMDWRGDSQPYTQHPAAAWLVVERMRDSGYRLRLHGWQPSGWTVLFHHVESNLLGDAGAEELPDAICLAALLALAGEPEPT